MDLDHSEVGGEESYRGGDGDIYTMDPNGSLLRQLTFSSGEDGDPAWSPDGARIAFSSSRDARTHIWVMAADGSNQQRLTDGWVAMRRRPGLRTASRSHGGRTETPTSTS